MKPDTICTHLSEKNSVDERHHHWLHPAVCQNVTCHPSNPITDAELFLASCGFLMCLDPYQDMDTFS